MKTMNELLNDSIIIESNKLLSVEKSKTDNLDLRLAIYDTSKTILDYEFLTWFSYTDFRTMLNFYSIEEQFLRVYNNDILTIRKCTFCEKLIELTINRINVYNLMDNYYNNISNNLNYTFLPDSYFNTLLINIESFYNIIQFKFNSPEDDYKNILDCSHVLKVYKRVNSL